MTPPIFASVGGVSRELSEIPSTISGVERSLSCMNAAVGAVQREIFSAERLPAIGTALNDMTWEEIRAISDAGLAKDYFHEGDIKTITINGKVGNTTFTNLSIDAFIIGINHNEAVEGSNRIHFQIGRINGVDVALCDSKYNTTGGTGYFIMNTSAVGNSGGWASCYMRTTILGSDSKPTNPTANTLLAALPSDLRAVMKSVTKRTDNTGGGSNTASYVTATTDYLPLLAYKEVFGSGNKANSAERNYQEQYAYYAAGNSKKKYKHSAPSTSVDWWLRSVIKDMDDRFCAVMTTGDDSALNVRGSYGVSPLFCV